MTEVADYADFHERLRRIYEDFRNQEIRHREPIEGADPEVALPDILERVTRRFLIDPLLESLDWRLDDPGVVAEEVRSSSADKDRFFFDYLGFATDREPALLFEAKAFDVELPRKPRQPAPGTRDMPALLAAAIGAINRDTASGLVAEWDEYLTDLRGYVRSLAVRGHAELKRVAISSGRWMIVFRDPHGLFDSQSPAPDNIDCFDSFEDMMARHGRLYDLLHRRQLVDTLPTVLDIDEVVRLVRPTAVRATSRGVVLFTQDVGAERGRFPARWLQTAFLVDVEGRWFAIVDRRRKHILETGATEKVTARLTGDGLALEALVRRWIGRDVPALDIEAFPGLPVRRHPVLPGARPVAPLAGSTNAGRPAARTLGFVSYIGTPAQYLVVTGASFHYKSDAATACVFHGWLKAREHRVHGPGPVIEQGPASFTEDLGHDHCAHHDHKRDRHGRCHVAEFEQDLCCPACRFSAVCWPGPDGADASCPSRLLPDATDPAGAD